VGDVSVCELRRMLSPGLRDMVDAFASESYRRAEQYWSRFAESGREAVDALSEGDWGTGVGADTRRRVRAQGATSVREPGGHRGSEATS
jgi:hypothetical protein